MFEVIVLIFLFCIIVFLAIIILQVAGCRRSLDILGHIVAVGMQRAGLVRTEKEVEADLEEALQQEEEDIVL